MFKKALLEQDRPVPRYTSYPPATCFVPARSDATHAQNLCFSPPSLGLYLHIPFCNSLCHYCGCHMKVTHDYLHIKSYLDVLTSEAQLVADMLPRHAVIHDVHFGGGSPSIIKPADFAKLLNNLRSILPIAPDAKIALEADPRTTTSEHIDAYAAAKVSRISLGVQDLNRHVLGLVNRPQTPEMTAAILDQCSRRNIKVNFDIMYGLPGQTPASVALTLQQVGAMRPDRISFFGYAHVPWVKMHMNLISADLLPSPAMRLDMATSGAAILEKEGYTAIGIDHFYLPDDDMAATAKQGHLRRNFQGYTTLVTEGLIGLGVSAISDFPGGYAQNTTDIIRYRREISEGKLPTAREYARTKEDAPCAYIIERLMCDQSVDLQEVAEKFGVSEDTFIPTLRELTPYFNEDMIYIENGSRLVIRPAARLLTRVICLSFDRHAPPSGQKKHAQAI
jgi:oxygen-independent coproporphyrinogen-3 oxidase